MRRAIAIAIAPELTTLFSSGRPDTSLEIRRSGRRRPRHRLRPSAQVTQLPSDDFLRRLHLLTPRHSQARRHPAALLHRSLARDPGQAAPEPPRRAPSRNLQAANHLVRLSAEPRDGRRSLRRLLRLRRPLPRRARRGLAPREQRDRSQLRRVAVGAKGSDEGYCRAAVHLPLFQRSEAFGLGHCEHDQQQAGTADGLVCRWAERC